MLHWTEDEFWTCGFAFFRATWEGWAIASGVRKVGPKAPTREDYEAAKAALAERDRMQFPKGTGRAKGRLAIWHRRRHKRHRCGAVGATAVIGRMRQTAEAVADIDRQAKMVGLDVDVLADGMKELNLRAYEFIATGKGSAAEAFGRLGFSSAELARKVKEDALKRLALAAAQAALLGTGPWHRPL